MKDDIIRKVALDIGNNKIKLLVGEMSSDFQRISSWIFSYLSDQQ